MNGLWKKSEEFAHVEVLLIWPKTSDHDNRDWKDVELDR
jgi:hypothetical protein